MQTHMTSLLYPAPPHTQYPVFHNLVWGLSIQRCRENAGTRIYIRDSNGYWYSLAKVSSQGKLWMPFYTLDISLSFNL